MGFKTSELYFGGLTEAPQRLVISMAGMMAAAAFVTEEALRLEMKIAWHARAIPMSARQCRWLFPQGPVIRHLQRVCQHLFCRKPDAFQELLFSLIHLFSLCLSGCHAFPWANHKPGWIGIQ